MIEVVSGTALISANRLISRYGTKVEHLPSAVTKRSFKTEHGEPIPVPGHTAPKVECSLISS